jgi:hypothetical protein
MRQCRSNPISSPDQLAKLGRMLRDPMIADNDALAAFRKVGP